MADSIPSPDHETARCIMNAVVRAAERLYAETGTTDPHLCELTPTQYAAVVAFDRDPGPWTMGPLPVVMIPTRTVAIEGVELISAESAEGKFALSTAIRQRMERGWAS